MRPRLRSIDNRAETRLLAFPEGAALAARRADPRRLTAQMLRDARGATVSLGEVRPIA